VLQPSVAGDALSSMRGIDLAEARVNWTTHLCSGPEVLHEATLLWLVIAVIAAGSWTEAAATVAGDDWDAVVAPYSADLIWMALGATAPDLRGRHRSC
jgi:hypothetical protein